MTVASLVSLTSLVSHLVDRAEEQLDPPSRPKRLGMLATGTVLLAVAAGLGVVGGAASARAMDWVGQQGYLTITQCYTIQQKHDAAYDCHGTTSRPEPTRARPQSG